MKTIAVDFDGTLCENAWPGIGSANRQAIRELIRRQDAGDKLILWTCRSGRMLDEAVSWCRAHGLRFDAVNDNLPEHVRKYGNNCRKVFADEYWDDKSVQVGIYEGITLIWQPMLAPVAETRKRQGGLSKLLGRRHKWR